VAFELVVERPAAAQHVVEDVGGKKPRSETRRAGGVPSTGWLLAPLLHCENSSLRQAQGYAKSEAMPIDPTASPPPNGPVDAEKKRRQSEAAERALAEAAARRAARDQKAAAQPKEIQGREGPDPTRYGDWEKDGLISDF
jgi:hypothetical protein